MAHILLTSVFFSAVLYTVNAGVVHSAEQTFPEPATDVTVLKNEAVHDPMLGIVPPGNSPAYIVHALRVNIPFDPLVFPDIAQVPSNAIIKSPPLRLLQRNHVPAVSYGAPVRDYMTSYGVPDTSSSEDSGSEQPSSAQHS